jgi:hypothetical protein
MKGVVRGILREAQAMQLILVLRESFPRFQLVSFRWFLEHACRVEQIIIPSTIIAVSPRPWARAMIQARDAVDYPKLNPGNYFENGLRQRSLSGP